MPYLSNDSLVVGLQFLQILLWISIPALLVAMLITTMVHYSNKRKKLKKKEEQPFIFAGDESCSGYDDITLIPAGFYSAGSKPEIKRLMQNLSHSNARYIAMRRDFEVLSKKYQKLQTNNYKISETIKNKSMETIHTTIQPVSGEQVHTMQQKYESEKKELLAELNQLNTAYENLEKDNCSLQEQLAAYSNDEAKVTFVIQKWEQEKAELKRKISEHEYLKDVLEEKKIQINFLQQQLEQRIKNHHLVEQQFRELGIKFMEVTEKLEIDQQSAKEFQDAVHEKVQEINSLKDSLQTATANTAQVETTMKEVQEQNSKLSLEIEVKNNFINSLEAQLAESNDAKTKLEERLERSQTFFKGFHRKLSDILQEEIPESPVILMKPVYKQETGEEQITESAIQ